MSWAISRESRKMARSPAAMCSSEYAAPPSWAAKSRFLLPLDRLTTSEYRKGSICCANSICDAVSGISSGAERRLDMLSTPRTSDGLLRLLSVLR